MGEPVWVRLLPWVRGSWGQSWCVESGARHRVGVHSVGRTVLTAVEGTVHHRSFNEAADLLGWVWDAELQRAVPRARAWSPATRRLDCPRPRPQRAASAGLGNRRWGQIALGTEYSPKRPHIQGQPKLRQASSPVAVMETSKYRAEYSNDKLPVYMDEFLPGILPT